MYVFCSFFLRVSWLCGLCLPWILENFWLLCLGYYVILAFLCPYGLMVPVIFLLGSFLLYNFFFFPFCNAVDQTQALLHARQELYSCFMLSSNSWMLWSFPLCYFFLFVFLASIDWNVSIDIFLLTNCFLHFVELLDEAIEGIHVMVFYF